MLFIVLYFLSCIVFFQWVVHYIIKVIAKDRYNPENIKIQIYIFVWPIFIPYLLYRYRKLYIKRLIKTKKYG